MNLKQRKRIETIIDLELTLTADENDTLFAELEEVTRKMPDGYKSILNQIRQNMMQSSNVYRVA